MKILHKTLGMLVLALGIAAPVFSSPTTWPTKTVQIVLPIDAGTMQDVVSRRLATELSTKWGQPVVVLNKTGAGGIPGTQFIATSPADGYTLGVVGGTFTGVLATRSNLPYSRNDLVGITKFSNQNFLIFAGRNAPFNTVQEMIAFAKTNPGQLTFASPGVGSMVHIGMEHLASNQKVQVSHVPYRGMMMAAPDVISGRVHTMITSLNPTLDSMIQQGDLKIIGSFGDSVSYNNTKVPSVGSVVPGVRAAGYFAIVAPKRTPKSVIEKVQKDVASIIARPEFTAMLIENAVPPSLTVTHDFDQWIDYEIARIQKIVSDVGLVIQN